MPILLRRLLHYAAYLAGAVVILLSVIALSLRFVVMPEIDRYRPDVERLAGRAVGIPVRIAGLEADWRGLNPRLRLQGVELIPHDAAVPLRLPHVELTVSWLSLLVREPRLARLDLLRPMLEVRRDPGGALFIAGIPVNQPGAKSPFPDWLLRQHEVTVSEGRLVWRDERLAAPPLHLESLNLRLSNRFGRHRFGLVAQPTEGAMRSLEARGDLHGTSVHAPDAWDGTLFVQARHVSALAMLRWAPWAQESVRQGVGDARAWLTLDHGRLTGVAGDVDLAGVGVRFAGNRPDITFKSLSGHLDWRREKGRHLLRVDRLHAVTPSGQSTQPARLEVMLRPGEDGRVAEARVSVDDLRLEALTALTHTLPLPARVQDWIERHNPAGTLDTVEVSWTGAQHYRIKTRFRNVGMSGGGDLPGFSGLDGEIEADENRGQVKLSSRGLGFSYAPVFRQPLELRELEAKLGWARKAEGSYRVTLERARLSNADLDGLVYGSLETRPGQAPVADIRAQLKRGAGNAVWKYLPWQVGDDSYRWVKASIRAGTSPDTRLVLRGPLDRFPFEAGEGEFMVSVKVQDALLDYAPDWPSISGIDGWLVFKGANLSINSSRGRILDVPLGPVKASIADLMHPQQAHLLIEGSAEGPSEDFLAFIRKSPVFDYTDRFTAPFHAEGRGKLRLNLDLPLHDLDRSKVNGQFEFNNNRLDVGHGLPTLQALSGKLAFSESGIVGQAIRTQLYGEAATLDLASERGGRVRVELEGGLPARALSEWLPAAMVRRLSGRAAYRAEIGLRQDRIELAVDSNLRGLGIQLPAPLGKPAGEARKLTLRLAPTPKGESYLRIQMADILQAGIAHPGEPDARIGLRLGTGEPGLPEQPGISVQGALHKLDLDTWQSLRDTGSDGGESPVLREINLSFNELNVFDRRFHGINVQARPVQSGWRMRLAGREVVGDVTWDEPGGLPGKRLTARFDKLVLPPLEGAAPPASQPPAELPRIIDVQAKSFSYAGRDLGSLVANMQAEGSGLRIRDLALVVPEARLAATGWLSASSRRPTQVVLDLNASDTGRLLARLGYPDGIRGGSTRLSGNLNWPGRFEDFDVAKLNGRLRANLQDGRFIRLDPGIGRLLGIFNLQSLSRRASLDIRDMFSEGFAFDRIEGDLHIERGALYLPDFQINGPPARVQMNGKVDMVAETQNLRLRVQPRIDESAAIAGALLGGPVVGLGTLVATKLLKDPIGQAASFEYLVTGSWAEPNVARLPRNAPALEAAP
jgi:uncharacterized protein (TIGR02099 family)